MKSSKENLNPLKTDNSKEIKNSKDNSKENKSSKKNIILKNIDNNKNSEKIAHFLQDLTKNGFSFDIALKINQNEKTEKKLSKIIYEFKNSLINENECNHFKEKIYRKNNQSSTRLVIPCYNKLKNDKKEKLKHLLKKNLDKNKEIKICEIKYKDNKKVLSFKIDKK